MYNIGLYKGIQVRPNRIASIVLLYSMIDMLNKRGMDVLKKYTASLNSAEREILALCYGLDGYLRCVVDISADIYKICQPLPGNTEFVDGNR